MILRKNSLKKRRMLTFFLKNDKISTDKSMKGAGVMYKKHFFAIILSQIMVPLSMLLPVMRIEETRINFGGVMTTEKAYVNIFKYLSYDVYLTVGIIMLSLAIVLIIACANSLLAIYTQSKTLIYAKMSFFYSLATAIMGAFAAGVSSYALTIICACSFTFNSVLSIRVIKRLM
jgi:hypothetical protein